MKNKTIKILSTSSDKGKRIDIFLSEKLKEMTRSNVKKMINQKKVAVNNVIVESQSKKIKDNDEINITFSFLFLCSLTITCSICILYSLWFFISTTTIWFVKTWNATEVLRSFLYIGRFPLNSFSFSLRIFFSVLIPIAFITTIPSEVFLGISQLWKILIEVVVALLFISTSRKFWLFALKFYSSASS